MKLRKPIANMGEILDQMSTEKTRLINEPLDVSKYVGKTHSENPMKQVDTAKLPLPKKIATVIIGSNKSFALWLTSQPLIKKQLVGLKKAITKSVLGYSYSEEGFQKVWDKLQNYNMILEKAWYWASARKIETNSKEIQDDSAPKLMKRETNGTERKLEQY